MGVPHDISGQRFGRLVATACDRRDWQHSYWRCQCDCGASHITTLNSLRRGLVVSCGCYRREFSKTKATKHAATETAEYRIWAAMKRRCANPNVRAWKDYGGRGIKVCERWQQFENFLADMGPRPLGLTLDRIDHDGHYEPGNCRWATYVEQANNTRGNRLVFVGDRVLTVTQACGHYGIPVTTVWSRISRGWPPSDWFLPKIEAGRTRSMA